MTIRAAALALLISLTACSAGSDGAAPLAGSDVSASGDGAGSADATPASDGAASGDSVAVLDTFVEPDTADPDASAAPDGSASPDTAVGPAPVTGPGPWRVGYRTFQVTYTPETFAAPRTLQVSMWYPTADTEGTPANYLGFVDRPELIEGATPLAGSTFPLMLFSHGNSGIEVQNWFQTELLASHGWVVVAPRHTGNSLLDFDQSLMTIMWILRPLDIQATLDHVLALPAGDTLSGRFDDRIAMAGHSFGGYTTLAVGGARIDVDAVDAACAQDPGQCAEWTPDRRALAAQGFGDARFRALVPMTPWRVGFILPPGGTDTITAPTLLMTGALDTTTPNADDGDPIWAGFTAPVHLRADFTDAGHFTFSHACELGYPGGNGCGAGFVTPEDAFATIGPLTLAWLRRHVLDDASVQPLLDGEVPLPAKVVLSHPQ